MTFKKYYLYFKPHKLSVQGGIMININNLSEVSDEKLKQLMIKYKEKQVCYELMYNEVTKINEKIILSIHLEQIIRFKQNMFKSKMDTSI